MPELPEVETVRRGLALKMSGRRILQAELRRPDLRRPFPPALAVRLKGARIGALGRRGKYILIELDADGLRGLNLESSDLAKDPSEEPLREVKLQVGHMQRARRALDRRAPPPFRAARR